MLAIRGQGKLDDDAVLYVAQEVIARQVREVLRGPVRRHHDGNCEEIFLERKLAAGRRRELDHGVIFALQLLLMIDQELQVSNII